ncbi:MAG: phosphate-starvation-inducible PsiE family protein [Metallosphaera sp.]|nr:phosphate-starvation-inducible PsiE family protein [Metallosphaera cuprina]
MKLISSTLIFKVMSIIVQALLIVGLATTIISTITQILVAAQSDPLLIPSVVIENVLLIIVFLEIYLSALDFFTGKGRSLVYVIDAMISFVSREIIIEILTLQLNYTDLLTLGGLLVAGAVARLIITERFKKRKKVRNSFKK